MLPFDKDEVYELNEWIREKRGNFEEWLRDRKADRNIEEAAKLADEDNSGVQRVIQKKFGE